MKIVIAGGDHAADYIIKNFKGKGHKLIVINENRESAEYISNANKIPVLVGDASANAILSEAHIENADIFIALGSKDCDNYVACLHAKKTFNAKKCICIVNNPKNVDIFRELGVDSVISSTHLLASSIVSESSLENITKTMSLEDDKIVLTEAIIRSSYWISHKKISEINFPKYANISCIYRRPNVIIPNGSTEILPKDKLLIVCSPVHQKEITKFIQKEHTEN